MPPAIRTVFPVNLSFMIAMLRKVYAAPGMNLVPLISPGAISST